MEDCIFCKIIKGDIPSKTIYEDDIVKVMMDINPVSDGHLLILTKKHITDFLDLDNETASHINEITKTLKTLIANRLNPDGIQFINNYGCAQEVKHYHLHMIPVYKDKTVEISLDETFDILTR